jgi:hypothetical protein
LRRTFEGISRIRTAKIYFRGILFAFPGVLNLAGAHGARREKDPTMSRITMVRYAAKPERAEENEALSRAVFEELRAAAPEHVAYGLFRDGLDFVHLFVNLRDDDSSPVTELPSFKTYAKDIVSRCEAPPEPTRLHVELVESYGIASA